MSIDGVFIHNLIKELKQIENVRINKIYDINEREFLFNLSNKQRLIISLNLDHSHLRLTNNKINTYDQPSQLCMILRKHLEKGIIKSIDQFNNDRICIITVQKNDELGYKETNFLILELIGRHANLILTNSDYIIIESLKRTPLDSMRLIIPKVKYEFPLSNKTNPFLLTSNNIDVNDLEGVSNILKQEIRFQNSIINVINQPIKPTLVKANDKYQFYCFDLKTFIGEKKYFNSLSELLDYYYFEVIPKRNINQNFIKVEKYLNREIKKQKRKISKQQNELQIAQENLKYEHLGNLLASNLHLVQPKQLEILVEDFYNNNETVLIKLDPQMSAAENLEHFFNIYKKANRTINFLENEINNSYLYLDYLNNLKDQTLIANNDDIIEIINELGLNKKQVKIKKKQSKPRYLTYTDKNNNLIFVGKNNTQNNYITHELANRNDYFFHIKDYPGSHVIVRTNNLTDELIVLAANLAIKYSSVPIDAKLSVDYTLVRNVRRIKNQPGSQVTYTNFKTIIITLNEDLINSNLTLINHNK